MSSLDRAGRLVLLAAVGLWLPAFGFLVLHLASPSDGARLPPGQSVWRPEGVVVAPLVPAAGQPAAGLQSGDVVTRVDGRSLESWAQALLRPLEPRPLWRVGQVVTYHVLRDGQERTVPVALVRYPLGAIVARDWGALLFAVVHQAICAFIFSRRPRDPAVQVLFVSAAGMLSASTWSLGLQVGDLVGGLGFYLYTFTTFGAYMLVWSGSLAFALLFPRPRSFVRKRPWLIPALFLFPYVEHIVYASAARLGSASMLEWLGRAGADVGWLQAAYLLLTVGAVVTGYRELREAEARLQVRWVVYAFALTTTVALVLAALPEVVLGYPLISWNTSALTGLLVPIALAFAILRYRLFDIDVLINRTLVYGGLTASIVALYAVVVAALGAAFEARGNFAVSLAAAGLVAVVFQPLRERLQRAVNRLMHGDRDDPSLVLGRLGRRLESALSPEAVLPAIVEMVAQALKLPYVAIGLRPWSSGGPAAEYGLPAPVVTRLPLTYQGETIGELLVAPRAPGEPFAPAEYRLLENIAHQAGAAAHAVRLTADLRRSRERLVTAREEERRRLRRDLHDGLGPALAAQTLKVGAARAILRQAPEQADDLLRELERDTETALADIRRLVYDLRPPALDELGLAGAVREAAARYGQGTAAAAPRIVVETPEHLPPLPAAVEVAAYRIVQEALTNVVRHAQARSCRVRLWLDGGLRLEVHDDGVGLPAARRAGVGLASMRERAEELGGACRVEALPGGGTRVLAHLPLSALE